MWGNWDHAVKIKLTLSGPQWAEALDVFTEAANYFGMVSRKSLWGQFWSSHQRFFKYLCIASKVRRLVELAKKELEAGKVSSTTPLKESLVCILHVFCLKLFSVFFLSGSASWLGYSPQVKHGPEKFSMKMKDTLTNLCLLQSKYGISQCICSFMTGFSCVNDWDFTPPMSIKTLRLITDAFAILKLQVWRSQIAR